MRTVAAIALLCATAVAQLPIVQTVLNNGPTASRYDIVILGDGYQAFEVAQFNQDVTTFLTGLFQQQPYATFASYYNVHTVFRPSLESGADRPDETPPVFRNTAYDATYNYGGVDRCLYIQNTSLALADAALAPANEGRVLVLVNDTRYGGCASTFAVSYNGSQMVEVQTHELGHSLGQLADEYDYPNQTYTGPEPTAVNITKSPLGAKWAVWHGTDGISAFEGAGYYLYGLYRPRTNCLMRSLGQALCRVCQENLVKLTNAVVQVIVSATPTTSSVQVDRPNQQVFSFVHIVPPGNNPLVEWTLDGNVVVGANTTTFVLDSTTVPVGAHTLTASVLDRTPLVRQDPAQVMREERTWQVLVTDPTLAQLRVPTFVLGTTFAMRGSTLNSSTTVVNDGPGGAGPFVVEWFLSTTNSWNTTQSTLLGRRTVNGLGAGQQAVLAEPLQLPWSLRPQLHYVYAVVDRVNAVPESNEADNERLAALFGQSGACVQGLEFQDPLTPPFAATISRTTGGVLHPTVVAPCANSATSIYLIVWSASGTAPGTPLAPGVTLPLNIDPLTQLGLDNLNGPVFQSFLGVFDAQGIGRATLALPPAPWLAPGSTHFAAVLLGASTLFTGTTNPVQLSVY
jgi:hypothetical protein